MPLHLLRPHADTIIQIVRSRWTPFLTSAGDFADGKLSRNLLSELTSAIQPHACCKASRTDFRPEHMTKPVFQILGGGLLSIDEERSLRPLTASAQKTPTIPIQAGSQALTMPELPIMCQGTLSHDWYLPVLNACDCLHASRHHISKRPRQQTCMKAKSN